MSTRNAVISGIKNLGLPIEDETQPLSELIANAISLFTQSGYSYEAAKLIVDTEIKSFIKSVHTLCKFEFIVVDGKVDMIAEHLEEFLDAYEQVEYISFVEEKIMTDEEIELYSKT